MVIAALLVSCTSTGSGINTNGTGLLAGVVEAPQTTALQNAQTLGQQAVAGAPNSNLALNASPAVLQQGQQLQALSLPVGEQGDQSSQLVAAAAAAAASNPANLDAATPKLQGSSQSAPAALPSAAVSLTTNNTVLEATNSESQVLNAAVSAAEPEKTIATALPVEQAVLTATPPALPAPVKKKSLFESLFTTKKSKSVVPENTSTQPVQTQLALVQPSLTKASIGVDPVLQPPEKLELANLSAPVDIGNEEPPLDNGELPGVRKGALFEIKRRDSLQDDTDVDIGETDGGPVLLASAAGLARLAPNGLRVQRETVDVACIKPQLVKLLKTIERHYSRPVIVSSGYRSPGYNRRVRGAKNSLHMFCAAVDIQVVGVSKWQLAKYARTMQGRGGVGTYCHTESVHIDVGPDRDWNWRCARRK